MFSRVNANVEEISNIQPLANYFGKKPDLARDKFDRNVVSKLSDIDFEEESEDDFEDIKNIKRYICAFFLTLYFLINMNSFVVVRFIS